MKRGFLKIALGCLLVSWCARDAQQGSPAPVENGNTKIEVHVNSVLVPVVARDAQGRVVGNLTKEHFQVFDKEKPRITSGFSVVKRAALPSVANAADPATPLASGEASPVRKQERNDLKLQARRGYVALKPEKVVALLAAPVPPVPQSLPAPQAAATPQSPTTPQSSATPQTASVPTASAQTTATSPASATPQVAPTSVSRAASQRSDASQPSATTQALAASPSPATPPAPQGKDAEKKPKSRFLLWDPPDVDAQLHPRSSSLECFLSAVLAQAGTRATELVQNLQDFTAQERIEYRVLGIMGNQLDQGAGTFDYTAVFEQGREGYAVQEGRAPERGNQAVPVSTQDVGLPEMALVFLPEFQDDYEMKCEGAAEWNRRSTWVVRFHQRKDRPSHTASFSERGVVYPAKFKGRAWIAQDTGAVVHLEMGLMQGIPAVNVKGWYLSIDYAPVQFRTRNVKIWLPQSVDAYGDFNTRRTITSHSFSNFLLFSVQTDEVIDKPKAP
jgi:hypothetical protein